MERKEAIEIVKKLYNESLFMKKDKEAMVTLIPELKESEDERMLREVKKYIKEQGDKPTGLPNGTVAVSDMLAWLEKQCENKPDDKVEPKFKVGDWVKIDKGNVMKILEVKKDVLCYKILNWYGDENIRKISDIDSISHLWTIQDAKDGDVLAIDWYEGEDCWGEIIIFKKYHEKGVEGLFYGPCVEGYGNTIKNGELAWNDENVPYYSQTWTSILRPATKEQRDLLFQKMKEAGYDWDAEKKELRKIEKKPANEMISLLRTEYEKGRADAIAEMQKPAWSEEDEKILGNLINDTEKTLFAIKQEERPDIMSGLYGIYIERLHWLKSLKERMKGGAI